MKFIIILFVNIGLVTSQATRARLGLGSKKARLGPLGPIRRWNEASAYGLRLAGSGLHQCDTDSGALE